MKKTCQEILRSKSIDANSHNTSVCSILKDPSKAKSKHNRSVRFLEPDDLSSDESVESKPVSEQHLKNTQAALPIHSFFVKSSSKDYEKAVKNCLANNFKPKNAKIAETASCKAIEKNRIIKKGEKNLDPSNSPKFEPRTMNFKFRDRQFYEKLNRFMSGKTGESPQKQVKRKESTEELKSNLYAFSGAHSASKSGDNYFSSFPHSKPQRFKPDQSPLKSSEKPSQSKIKSILN